MAIKHYSKNDESLISPHFKASEFRCKCGGTHDNLISEELVQKLEALREALGCSKINVSSGYRCVAHDKAVGGSGSGQHTKGKAADICCYDKDGKIISSKLVCCKAQDLGFKGIANINNAYTYTHVDVRDGKEWHGNEIHGNSYCIPVHDFYRYFGIKKEKEVDPMKKGIDVSACQKHIDWSKVNVDFAILRAGYGRYLTQKDTEFESNYAGAKKKGIPIGAYWYSYAKTPEEARMEADVCLQVLKGKQFEYPIFFDIEESSVLALGKNKVSAIIRAFLETVEKEGYWVGLYMSASPLSSLVADTIKQRYSIWVAHIGVSKPSCNCEYGIWQYSWKGSMAGINGDVDLDYSYVDYHTQIKDKGLNGFGSVKVPETPAKKEITVEMTVDGTKFKGKLTEI